MPEILKNKYIPRVFAVLLAFVLCFGFAPAVFAMEGSSEPEFPEAETPEVPETEDEKPKATSGTCGSNLNWSFSGGTLTISGSGAMMDFPEMMMAPWYGLRREILAVVLPEGLTTIGDLAFYQCAGIKSVSIPNSVKKIGWYAFDGCKGIEMLNLGNGVEIIEEAAFRGCSSLKALRIPSSVKSVGFQTFSWCESITEVTIPASVTELEYAAFAFCKGLIRAEILAPIKILPDWTFYGCTSLTELVLPPTLESTGDYSLYDCGNLNNVVYTGDEENREEIKEDIKEETGSGLVDVSDSSNAGEDGSYETTIEGEDGSVVSKESSTTEDSAISTEKTVMYPEGETEPEVPETNVEITLENENGWNDVIDFIEETDNSDDIYYVNIYVKDDSEVPEEVIAELAGRNIVLTICNASGEIWQVDCSAMIKSEKGSALLISHSISEAEEKHLSLMGCQTGYKVDFSGDAVINAEVMIRLPIENAGKTATLFSVKGNKLTKFQTVLVDNEGYAHFYLGSISKKTVYLIGIDVPGEENSAIIPRNMMAEYGNPEYIEPIKYEITGRTSSWGMNLGQVMSILAVVMVTVIIVVGAVMYFWNRQRLKNGYVPQMDDEEE